MADSDAPARSQVKMLPDMPAATSDHLRVRLLRFLSEEQANQAMGCFEDMVQDIKNRQQKTEDDLGMTNRDLVATKRDLNTTKSDLDSTNSDLVATKHDLDATKRDLVATNSKLNATELTVTRLERVSHLTTPLFVTNVAAQLFTGLEKHLAKSKKARLHLHAAWPGVVHFAGRCLRKSPADDAQLTADLIALVETRNHDVHNLGKSLRQAEGLRNDRELLNITRAEAPLAVDMIENSIGIAFYLIAAEGISVCKGMLGDKQPVSRLYTAAQTSKADGMERISNLSENELQNMFDAFPYTTSAKITPSSRAETRDACLSWLQHVGDAEAIAMVCPGQPLAIPVCRVLPAMLQLADATGTKNVAGAVRLTRKLGDKFFARTRR